jgi:hypothetical protein
MTMTSQMLYRLSGAALIVGNVLTIAYYISEAFITGPFPEALADSVSVIGLPGMYARQASSYTMWLCVPVTCCVGR